MPKARMDLQAFVGKLLAEDDADVLREGVRVLSQALMEAEVSAQIGAEPYERSGARTAHRNGYRERTWETRVGTIELRVLKIVPGSYFPSLLEPRRRWERALIAVVQEAYVQGVSTRKVDDLVRSLGMEGISRSEVSRMCKELDRQVEAFRNRPIEGNHPYLWLDATFHKVRDGGRVVSMATVKAIGCNDQGERRVLGVDVGPSEDGAFWTGVPALPGCSRAHRGAARDLRRSRRSEGRDRRSAPGRGVAALPGPLHAQPAGSGPQGRPAAVAAFVRTIFAQPDHASAMDQLHRVADGLRPRFPRAAEMLEDAAEDLLAHFHFPAEHRRRLHSTDERVKPPRRTTPSPSRFLGSTLSLGGRGRPRSEEQGAGAGSPAAQLCPFEGLRETRPCGGGRAHRLSRCGGVCAALRLPVLDERPVGQLGLAGELLLSGADLLEGVPGGSPPPSPPGREAGPELEGPELLGGERRTLERVVLLLDHEVPAQDGEFAGHGHGRDVLSSPTPHPLVEGPKRPRGLGRGPGRLHEHASGMGPGPAW
jgi:putative transposase